MLHWPPAAVWGATMNELHQAWLGWAVANGKAHRGGAMMDHKRMAEIAERVREKGLLDEHNS